MSNAISKADIKTISKQLKREPRGLKGIALRCALGLPQVVETGMFLEGGQPFPTLYWITCPFRVKAISRLEDEGWAERLQARISEDESLRKRLHAAQEDYKARRRLSGLKLNHPVVSTGIGGVRDLGIIKCLHAHYAHYLATGENPIGEIVHESIAGLECSERCDRS
ncbi:MAG: DUF501 domain-containing protein [Actinobacteria bacterium]|nr:DUF501 domain-containing protein [Actinomycetota bacterium]